MNTLVDYGSLLAGLGFFLLGMQQLEHSLQALAGRSVKLFMRRYTRSPLQGIAVGTLATAILQSSSLVTLMLLAFVGAGILSLGNAIGVVLGANLGTTFTGWLVTAIGFKLDLESAAFPLIGIAALGQVFMNESSRIHSFARLLLALGFLLLGLDLMKTGVEAFARSIDLGFLRDYGILPFALAAFALTAVIQSSSAAMLINLSALAAGIVTLPQAAAFAIGADLGTTITVLLGAARGSAPARRVAMAHFLFNLCVDVLALLALYPLLALVTGVIGIDDPLFALVAFHSTFNLFGIALFLPLAQPFSAWLERQFGDREAHVARFISQVPTRVPDAAIEALQLECGHLFFRVLELNRLTLGIHAGWKPELPYVPPIDNGWFNHAGSPAERYEAVKELEGEILAFVQELQEQVLDSQESARLAQLQLLVRFAVQSAKSLKDVRHNLEAFDRSVNDALHARLETFRRASAAFYLRAEALWKLDRVDLRLAEVVALSEELQRSQTEQANDIYRNARKEKLGEREISTLLNVNRELYSSSRSLLQAMKEFLLPQETAKDIAELPGVA